MLLSELLTTTKDGDWGSDKPDGGFVPYRVIRGADFPEVRVGDISTVPIRFLDPDTVARRTLQPNDLVIETAGGNRDRPTGRTLLVTEHLLRSFDLPVTCASFCRFLRVDSRKADPAFVFWFLQYLHMQGEMWQHQVQHTGVARFQYTRFAGSIDVPLPPMQAQTSIAKLLGGFDDKIALNRRTNETLEAMARTIFKSWFVDFDPVHARYEGRETPLSKEIADLFPTGLCESALGPIPIGWDLTTWGTLVSLEYGKALSGYDTEEGAYPVYGTNGRIGTHSQALCPHPGVIIGRKGAYRGVHYSITPFFAIDTAFYVKPKVPLELRWAYYDLLRRDINNMDSGSAIPSTSRDDFYALEVIFPPVEVQRRYTKLLDPMWRQQQQNLASIRTLTALRDALLPKLISGEARVNAVNRFAETIA